MARIEANPVSVDRDTRRTAPYAPVPLDERLFDESWLQDLLVDHPGLLPAEQIDARFGPLVPIGREVGAGTAGAIDNLFVDPQGNLTIVETKLWRNPDARRRVVSQILDYASQARRWTTRDVEGFVQAFRKQRQLAPATLFEHVRAVPELPLADLDETEFYDGLASCLSLGRFLLLIVGDGIRPEAAELAKLVGRHANLEYKLAFVQLRCFRHPGGPSNDLLIVPQVPIRTEEIQRHVVTVRVEKRDVVDTRADVVPAPTPESTRRRVLTEDDFLAALAAKNPVAAQVARAIFGDAQQWDANEWVDRGNSIRIRYAAPRSHEQFSPFGIDLNGQLDTWPGWLTESLTRAGYEHAVGERFIARLRSDLPVRYRARDPQGLRLLPSHRARRPGQAQASHQSRGAFVREIPEAQRQPDSKLAVISRQPAHDLNPERESTMPRTIDEAFADFLFKLTPSPTESEAAKRHRQSIRNCLDRAFGVQSFFRTGSFGNGTSISGFSDVDYFVEFSPGTLTSNSTYTLEKVRAVLDTCFPRTGVRVSSPAVLIPFGFDGSESTEVVPANGLYRTGDGSWVFDIPDRQGGWMKSSPEAHKSYVRFHDDRLLGKLRPLIRLMKAWKYLCNVPISSFYLEMRTAAFASTETSIIYSWDLTTLFSRLVNSGLPALQDPVGISGYIHPCATEAMRKEALSKLETAQNRTQRARDAERNSDPKTAMDTWNLVFPGKFPGYYR